jgi:hypothetical protein
MGEIWPIWNLGSTWLGTSLFSPIKRILKLCVKGSAQQLGDTNEPTWSKTFSVLANQKKKSNVVCQMKKQSKKKKQSTATINVTVVSVLCHALSSGIQKHTCGKVTVLVSDSMLGV